MPEHATLDRRSDHVPVGRRLAMPRLSALVVRRHLGGALLLIGAVPLTGWLVGARSMTTWFFDRAPLRPGVAVGLILVAILVTQCCPRIWYRRLTAAVTIAIGGYGLASAFTEAALPLEHIVSGTAEWYAAVPGAGHVPLLSGALMVTLGVATISWNRWQRTTHILLVVIIFATYVSLIGQVFGAAQFYQLGGPATMPAMSAVGLLMAAVALLIGLRPRGLMRFIFDGGSAGALVRPVLIGVPLAIPVAACAAMVAHELGYFDHGTLAASISASGLLAATVVVRWAAVRLRALDDERERAYQRLDAANDDLAQRVEDRTAELHESMDLFSTAFESAPVGMALRNMSGHIIRANRALADLTGISTDALVGMEFVLLLHADDRARAEEWRHHMIAGTRQHYAEEIRIAAHSGEFRWVGLAGALLRDAAGRPRQILDHITDIDERINRERHLTQLAVRDPLTGLLNRRGFDTVLARCVTDVRRYGRSAALIALDLDNFKSVNDSAGHGCGDDLLVAVSGALQRTVRSSDSVARVGGDEFMVLLTDIATDRAIIVAQQLIDAVRATAAPLAELYGATVTASAGVAMVDEFSSGAETVRLSDRALYEAKDLGRNRWQLADRAPRAEAS